MFASRFSLAPGRMDAAPPSPGSGRPAPETVPRHAVVSAPLPPLEPSEPTETDRADRTGPARISMIRASYREPESARGGRVRPAPPHADPEMRTLPPSKGGRVGPVRPPADGAAGEDRFGGEAGGGDVAVHRQTSGAPAAEAGSLGGISLDRSVRLVRRGGAPDPASGMGQFSLAVAGVAAVGPLVPAEDAR